MAAGSPEQRKLTFRQESFIAAYLGAAHGNATEAARMAGYSKPRQEGSRLLANAVISARVSEHVAANYANADRVLQELSDMGLAPWRDFVEVIKRDPRTGEPLAVKFDLSAKVKSLELLGKFHQLFNERQTIDVNIREHRVGVPQSTLDEMFTPSEPDRLNA